MADLEQAKQDLKRQCLEGGKDQVHRFVMSIRDQLTAEESEELLQWAEGLKRVRVVGQPGLHLVHVDELRGGSGGVPKAERQGVYVHSFKCFNCGVHFMTFSWQAERHNVGNVMCPECGDRERLGHWRVLVNEEKEIGGGGSEIYDLCPYPGSGEPLPDSWKGD
ncbi:MAG: hypothetical protein P8X82_15620 [Gemmatimonadales bacterium]